MTDFETFLLDNSEEVFSVKKKKFMFTPYEEDSKFSDEDVYEYLGAYKFLQGIELPDSDILIEMKTVEGHYIEYHRLSEIVFWRREDGYYDYEDEDEGEKEEVDETEDLYETEEIE